MSSRVNINVGVIPKVNVSITLNINVSVYGNVNGLLTLRLLMSYIYGAPILDVSRSHTTTHHSR